MSGSNHLFVGRFKNYDHRRQRKQSGIRPDPRNNVPNSRRVSVALLRGDGVWETRDIYRFAGRNLSIECDLGRGSNHFYNSTSLRATIEVNGNGFNGIFCGDGNDIFASYGNSQDFVFGGGGDDVLQPGGGTDWILGGEGNDVLFDGGRLFFNPDSDGDVDWFYGGEGRDVFYAGTEDQVEDAQPEETVYRR